MSAAPDRLGGPAFVLPPGEQTGNLALRVLASIVDGLVPALASTGYAAASLTVEPGSATLLVLGIAAAMVILGWSVFVWWSGGERGATPGMRLVDLEIVGTADGHQIGWGRFFARQFAVSALGATVIGLPLMLIFLILDDNHRGWHDKLAQAVVIAKRQRGEPTDVEDASGTADADGEPSTRIRRRDVVGLPPHLAGAAAPASPAADPGLPRIEPPRHDRADQQAARPQRDDRGPAPQQSVPHQPPPHQPPPHQPAPQRQAPSQPGQQAQQWGPQPGPQQPGPPQPGPPQPGQQSGGQQSPAQSAPRPPQSQPSASQSAEPRRPQFDPGHPAQQPPRHQSTANLPPHLAHQLAEQPYVAQPWQPAGESAGAENPDATVLVPGRGAGRRPITDGWVLILEDGREVPIRPTVLLGRFPTPEVGEEVAELVAVDEGARMVSKTHLLVGVDNRGVYLVDRQSRNGSSLVDAEGQLHRLRPGEPVRVTEGQIVSFGDRRLAIRRTDG